MAESRIKMWPVLLGVVFIVAPPLCHARDTGKLFDVKIPPAEILPALVQKPANNPGPSPAVEQAGKDTSEHSWYWRLLEGLAFGLARVNTEKQNDGRPQPVTNPW